MMNVDLFLQTTMGLIKSDMLAKLDGGSFKTFMALGSFVDDEGYCYPNQATLAEMVGVSDRTIRKYIEVLLNYRTPNGEPILMVTKKKALTSKFYYNQYKVYPSGEDIINVEVVEEQAKEAELTGYKAKDVINLFNKLYLEKYGYAFRLSKSEWAQFTRLITSKVVAVYEDKDLVFKATEVLVNRYDELFKKPNYPSPTLWNYTTWVFTKCIDIAKAEATDTEALDERIEKEQAKADALLGGIETDEDVAALFARKRK